MSLQIQKLVYLILLLTGCSYAAVRGGAPERWGAALTFGAVVASNIAMAVLQMHFAAPILGAMAIDILYLLALLVLAARAERYWPIWAAAVQLNEVLAHLMMFSRATHAYSYAFALWMFSMPLPILLAAGTYRHRRRLALHGSDPSWSTRR